MRTWIVRALMGIGLLAAASGAAANSFHVVLNGFSQEIHAADGYPGILGRSARSISWWYRSHISELPPVWGIIFWGQSWSIQLENDGGGSLSCECGGTKIFWTTNHNPAMGVLQDGQWHHFVMTAPANGTYGDIRLYIDGALLPVVSVGGGSLANTYDTAPGNGKHFRAGARGLGNHADADMDEIALWDVELDAVVVAEIFNGGVPTDLRQSGAAYTFAADLQLYWRFEEGAGLTTEDLSGNGHGGVLIDGDGNSWGTNPPGSGADSDGDGILDGFDNCPGDFNPGQEDADLDQIGDACDSFPDDPDNDQAQCEADLANALADLDLCLNPPTQCSDGIDNDGDGLIDLEDRHCKNAEQDSERHPNQ